MLRTTTVVLAQSQYQENLMTELYYIGLDVHKMQITYCIKTGAGALVSLGQVRATRADLTQWAQAFENPWIGALEATLFTGWIYDHLRPFAQDLRVAHPAKLKAITCSKKKSDRIDAEKICDLLRVNLLPECHMAPAEIRELRRVLRYRNLLVSEATRMKNKISGLLMEVGAEYDSRRIHHKKYFHEYMNDLRHTPESVIEMLKISRGQVEIFDGLQRRLLRGLERHPLLKRRVELLQSIRGVGQAVALTWALEIGEHERFASIDQAVSYCGLCGGHNESAGKQKRGPISKQRNKHLQTMLVEAAKLAPRWNPRLRAVYEKELTRGNRNRATLEVARRLVAYLLAVDRSGRPFVDAAEAA
jgi:transposase